MNISITRCAVVALVVISSSPGFAMRPTGAGSTATMGAAPRSTTTTTTKPTKLGPTRTGQPNQECGSATAPLTPGNAAAAPGSAFNPSGKAGTVYAGEQPQNSRNTASVSQYDAACAHQR
jgi:hypothetical protein